MDPNSHKTLTTSRGYVYSYYVIMPDPNSEWDLGGGTAPTILFLHGFPMTSYQWKHQVPYFRARGFRLIIPDLLGFGGTSKPVDPEAYRFSLVCRDIMDILDAEGVERVVAVGHDLGSKIVSRLANLYGTHFVGYAFLAVPYCAPRPRSTMEYTLSATKRMCGYELCGHVLLFAEDDAHELLEDNLDSFYCAMFPSAATFAVTHVAPVGRLRKWIERDERTPTANFISQEDTRIWYKTFSKSLQGPLCWYKALVSGVNADDDKCVPLDKYKISQPVFFMAANHDYISRAVHGIATTKYHCSNACIRELHAGRWLMMSNGLEVNNALFWWMMDIL